MSYTEIINKIIRKTRKKHSCEWCAETIEVGQTAQLRKYVFNGDFMTGYMHLECKEAYGATNPDDLAEGWFPGNYKRGCTE